jgi:hypothetical protein
MDYSTLKGHVLGPSTGVSWLGEWLAARCLIIIFFLTFPFGRRNNDILQLGTYIKY